MQRTRHITIILADTLQSTGLHTILIDYFNPVEVSYYHSFKTFTIEGNESADYIFTDAETFIINSEYLLPRKSKVFILTYNQEDLSTSGPHYISVKSSQETIIRQIKQAFLSEPGNLYLPDTNKELSGREIEVLQQIVSGSTNKEIGDKLNISLNTVLSHRKNITAKLGIKTVSGLTYFAIMNGLISAEDIEI